MQTYDTQFSLSLFDCRFTPQKLLFVFALTRTKRFRNVSGLRNGAARIFISILLFLNKIIIWTRKSVLGYQGNTSKARLRVR